MNKQLLPNNSSALEVAAAQALAQMVEIPVPLRDLIDPYKCPLPLLPYLAWAYSVDYWDSDWSEESKREAVAAAYFVHLHKGTFGAVKRVVEPLGYSIQMSEWWQTGDRRGTFRLEIGVQGKGITDEMYFELERLINDAKPRSRHLIGLSINLESKGHSYIAAAAYSGDELTIYPYTPEEIIITGRANHTGSLHQIDTMRIEQCPVNTM